MKMKLWERQNNGYWKFLAESEIRYDCTETCAWFPLGVDPNNLFRLGIPAEPKSVYGYPSCIGCGVSAGSEHLPACQMENVYDQLQEIRKQIRDKAESERLIAATNAFGEQLGQQAERVRIVQIIKGLMSPYGDEGKILTLLIRKIEGWNP